MDKPLTIRKLHFEKFNFSIIIIWGITIALIGLALFAELPIWDYMNAYRPAIEQLFSGKTPYFGNFFNPPWGLVLYLPFAPFPVPLAKGMVIALNVLIIILISRELYKSWMTTLAMLISYPVYRLILHGQIDGIALLGLIFPPQIGLFFLTIKPNITFGIILLWLIKAWKEGGIRQVIKIFGPVAVAWGIATLIYGPFFLSWGRDIGADFNISLWPLSIPFGLWILISAIRKKSQSLALLSSPLLSPYVSFYSWTGAVLAAGEGPAWQVLLISVATWIAAIMGKLPVP